MWGFPRCRLRLRQTLIRVFLQIDTGLRVLSLYNFRIVARFAIHYLRPFWRITCFKLIGAGMLAMDMSGGILIYRGFGFRASCFRFPAGTLENAVP